MEKKLQIAIALATAAILFLIGYNFVQSPMEAKRDWLKSELSKVPEAGQGLELAISAQTSYSGLIGERLSVWGALVEKPKAAVVAKVIERPEIGKMLDGVQVTRFKIGDKIKIITKTNPDGGFYSIGDKVQGCTLKDFTRTDATFIYEWKEGKETLEMRMERY